MGFDFSKLTYRPGSTPAVTATAETSESAVQKIVPQTDQPPRRVVHCKHDRFDIMVDRTTKWGNPFRIGPDGDRASVIQKYRQWVLQQPELMSALPELRGKILGCWCAPKACHGDVLAELANDQLPADEVLPLWQERSAVQATDNTDLVRWHQDNDPEGLRRACELNAAADLSLSLGSYVEPIIQPHLSKRHLTEDERAQNIQRLGSEFDKRVKRDGLRQCGSCNGYAKLDRKQTCDECRVEQAS